jgi:hypothetical protein
VKTCFKCGVEKPRTEFYRHPQMGDGLLGKCKGCTKRDVSRDRLAKLEQKRLYDRARSTLPHRVELRRKVSKAWAQAHPERRRAQQKVSRMERKAACEGCSREGVKLEKHHPDYSKPLLVVWLCKPCHAIADKIRRIQESA